MDLETLNKHYDLVQKLKEAQELRKTTEAKSLGAQSLDGMPHGTGVSDKVGILAAALADISGQVSYLEKQVAESAVPIEDFVSGIGDLRTRLIFRYRFLNGMAWCEVADMFPGMAEATAKNVCYSYLIASKRDRA